MPSCGVANGGPKAERKHSVRANPNPPLPLTLLLPLPLLLLLHLALALALIKVPPHPNLPLPLALPLPLPLNPAPYNQVRAAQEIAISPPASPDASPRVDRVSPTTTHGDLGHLAC